MKPSGPGLSFVGIFFLYKLFFPFIYLFIYFWLRWVFIAACGLSVVAASGGYSSLWCTGLGTRASVFVAYGLSSCGLQALECRLSSCVAWALLLCSTWDLPGPGLEPVSPALAGGFLTTAPPGKPRWKIFQFQFHYL